MRLFVPILLSCAALVAAATRPVTARGLLDLRTIGEVALAPDGSAVLLAIRSPNLDSNRTETTWARLSPPGKTLAVVPGLPASASTVRWSPDSQRLAYISEKALYVLDLASGRNTRVCAYDRSNAFLSSAGNALTWSPDGQSLAFAGTLQAAPAAQDPVVISRIQYKSRTALADNRRTHLYLVPATGGTPKALTSGEFDNHSLTWTAGDEIVFLSNRETDPDAIHNYDLYAVHATTGTVRQITKTPGVEMEPVLSPDGRSIAYVATKRPLTTIDSVAEDAHLWVVPTGGGTPRELNAALDRRTREPAWSADGRTIYFWANDRGRGLIYRVPAGGGDAVPLFTADALASQAHLAPDGTAYFVYSDPLLPGELYQLGKGQTQPQALTALNDGLVQAWQLRRPETVSLRSFDGTRVEGWLYLPPQMAERAPLLLNVHGGPHGSYQWQFGGANHLLAARGYAVLLLNPRGSNGYGQRFSDGCVGDWGGADYKDLMAGVDHVLRTHPTIDPQRLGVTGGSYGGYMTNWIVTQTDRFKAAVALASVANLVSFYATSLYQDLVHAEFNGFPWAGNNFEVLWQRSPLAHIKNVKTPTLLLHGENDNDVHITQAEEMYTALRHRGVDSVLVRYPREGHGISEPKHVLDRNERLLAWLDRYLRR